MDGEKDLSRSRQRWHTEKEVPIRARPYLTTGSQREGVRDFMTTVLSNENVTMGRRVKNCPNLRDVT
jgi:hypothetical protein